VDINLKTFIKDVYGFVEDIYVMLHTVVERQFRINVEIINVKFEQTMIDIDSFFEELIFAKQFMFHCDKKKRW
jgi:hypothetical protein